ncbi:MAG TPA: hypothetical protein VF134_08525 [Candidatus Dormibacteraeota bacterium]
MRSVSPPPVEQGRLEQIARHEAGHVVVGEAMGLQLQDVDVLPDPDGGRGHTHFRAPDGWPPNNGLSPAQRDFVERVLTAFMAGHVAESATGIADPDGSAYDFDTAFREWLSYLTKDPEEQRQILGRCTQRANSILGRREARAALRAVADALLEKSRLSAAEATAIVQAI